MVLTNIPGCSLQMDWGDNRLVILSPTLPSGKVEILWLEAFCRKGSTHRAWQESVVPHQTFRLDGSGPKDYLHLRSTVTRDVEVWHELRVTEEGACFELTFTHHGHDPIDVEWAQPCIQVAGFTGRTQQTYLDRCFIFTDRAENYGLTLLSDLPRAEEALYRGGQVFVPAGINPADVNPRPISPMVPANGLIGCFSADNKWLLATAWNSTQELFQGVMTCIHSDFHIGGLEPGQVKWLYGRLYLLPNDIPLLLQHYQRDFPNSNGGVRSLLSC
jgi:hypothetical protein